MRALDGLFPLYGFLPCFIGLEMVSKLWSFVPFFLYFLSRSSWNEAVGLGVCFILLLVLLGLMLEICHGYYLRKGAVASFNG